MLLLTDGRVLVHEEQDYAQNWYALIPDNTGGYINGIWVKVASLPHGYRPLYFGSVVLPDGRVIIEGGELNNYKQEFTTKGAVYDPAKNTWTSIKPPAGWNYLDSSEVNHGFLRTVDGTITTLNVPGAGTGSDQGTFAVDINAGGAITGSYLDSSNVNHGFLRSK